MKNEEDEFVLLDIRKAWMFVLVFTSNVLSAQEISVLSREAADGDLSRMKTFAWASQVNSALDAGNYFLNDIVLKADFRDAVNVELDERGYRYDPESADIIINFRVFDEPVVLNTYESYGAAFWGDVEFKKPIDSVDTEFHAGTLIISMVDRVEGKLLWQGFASGLIENNKFVKEEEKVREAVKLIFERYNYRASGYTKR